MTGRDDDEEDRGEDATEREASPAPSAPVAPVPSASARDRRGAELDDDSPESIRLTFVLLSALGACICVLPRQWISAAIMGAVSAGLFVWHLIDKRRLGKARA
jgi:hypothetical protein